MHTFYRPIFINTPSIMITPERPVLKGTSRYSSSQAAEVLGIHRNTLLKWANEGKVSFRTARNGRRYYFGLELMRVWREEHR